MSKSDKHSGVRLVTVGKDRHGQRVDNFLVAQLKGLPRSAIYRMIRTGQVRVNGKRCKPTLRLSSEDQVRIPPARVREDGEVFISDRVQEQVRAAILYQDEHLVVLNKPSGMAVHSGSGLPWGVIDVVRRLFPDDYIELAHRLDRETSGCLVLARSGQSLGHLNRQFQGDGAEKRYLCLLSGRLREDLVTVDAPLKKVQDRSESRVVVDEDGKPACTRFRLLENFKDCSYFEAELLTGRTHQIRVHARFLDAPLAGDAKYSSPQQLKSWRQRGLGRIFLHAHRLVLTTPSGEVLELSAPLPTELRAVLDQLNSGA